MIDDDDNKAIQSNCFHSKVMAIESLLSGDEVDLWALREHCLTPGGLMNDSIRKRAWPKLVGVDFLHDSFLSSVSKEANATATCDEASQYKNNIDVIDPSSIQSNNFKKKVMARCLDARQIELDIARCTWHLLNGSQRSRRRQMRNKHKKKMAALLKKKQRRLGNLINLVLIQSYATSLNDFDDNRLRYYQGYHDISCIFLSVLGGVSSPHTSLKETGKYDDHTSTLFEQSVAASKVAKTIGLDVPSRVLLQISQSHLRDTMKSNFEAIIAALRLIIMPLIHTLDKEVHDHLLLCGMEPFFCFPWIITWFSHDIRDTSLVKRLFDVFLVSHPLMPIYMSIAMVLHPCNREEILNCECEFAEVHKTLMQLPRNSCSVGWRFVGNEFGGGYVSGDEEDGSKISLESASLLSDDGDRESILGDEASLAPSLASESIFSYHDTSRVPIQELIDLAIKFMRRIPPRNLPKLAQRYDGKSASTQITASINLFHQPPSWTVRAFAPSERAIRQFHKKKRNVSNEAESKTTTANKPVTEKMYPRAAIASGLGPDGEREAKRRLWKRKRIQLSAITVSIFAIAFGIANNNNEVKLLGTKTIIFSTKNILNTFGVKDIDGRREDICFNPDYSMFSEPKLNNMFSEETESNVDERNAKDDINVEIVDDDQSIKRADEIERKSPVSFLQPVKLIRDFAQAAKTSLSDEAEVILF